MEAAKESRLRKFRRGKRSLLGWCVVFVLLLYGYWLVMTSVVIDNFWDPQYGMKAELLRDLIKAHPGKPLWVMIGSSRVDFGVSPSVVQDWMNQEKSPLLFNFGISGAETFRELTCLRRLIADGMKPQRVGIEVLPICLYEKKSPYTEIDHFIVQARKYELEEYYRFGSDPKFVRNTWYESRLNPVYKFGMKTQFQTLPMNLLVPIPALRYGGSPKMFDQWGDMYGNGYPYPEKVTPAEYHRLLEMMRRALEPSLQKFSVSENSNRVMTEILDLCKEQKIDAFLIRMPESKEFQGFYSSEANQTVDDFIEKFKDAYGLKFVDARSWIDSDKFRDGHHMLWPGAKEFTKRLIDEIGNEPAH